MKKTTKTGKKKLLLTKEKVRDLTRKDAGEIAGGRDGDTVSATNSATFSNSGYYTYSK